MKQYDNFIEKSNISEVYTYPESFVPFIEVIIDGESNVFIGKEVVTFLNKAIDYGVITEEIENAIVNETDGIFDRGWGYEYNPPSRLLEYENSFRDDHRAIQNHLNYYISKNISQISKLKERFQEILGFDPAEGLCHSLIYFIVLIGIKSKEDFAQLFESDNIIDEQDIIRYIDKKEKQTYQLLVILVLSQYLPALDVQSFKKRENIPFSENIVLYKQNYDFDLEEQINIDKEKLNRTLNKIKIGYYVHFALDYDITNIDQPDGSFGHSMLIYKEEDDKYIFVDPNNGAIVNLTLNEVCETIIKANHYYLYNECILRHNSVPDQ